MRDNAANTSKTAGKAGAGRDLLADTGQEPQRREMRHRCDPTVALLELARYSEPIEGKIVEISKSGLRLRLENSVPAGESVQVTLARMVVKGQIRYCRQNEEGHFDTGVVILDVQYVN